MTKTSKLVLIAAITAFSIATPALAQYRDRSEDGFAMTPPNSTIAPVHNPEVIGGGSGGYNELLLRNQW